TLGITTPAWASDHCTRPEQSKASGPAAPHTYGRPSLPSAAFRNAVTSLAARPGPPAAPEATATPDAGACATSAATDAPRGSSLETRVISVPSSACGALITIAL